MIYAVPYNERRGIYYVRSNDGGTTWLTPILVFDAVAAKWESVDKPRLVLDANANVLHAVWLRASLLSGRNAGRVLCTVVRRRANVERAGQGGRRSRGLAARRRR